MKRLRLCLVTRYVLHPYSEILREHTANINVQVAVRLHDANKLDNPKAGKDVGGNTIDDKRENNNETDDFVETVEKGEHVEELA